MIEFNKLNFENEKIKLSKSTIELLNIISLKFLKYSNLLFNEDQIFSEDHFIKNEIKKSIIRNLISYDETTVELSNSIIHDFKNHLNNQKIKIEISNPGIMFHLPNDLSEEGTYHYDQIGKKQTYTLWTPITEYDYNPIKYYSLGFHLFKFFKLIKLLKIFKVKYLNPIKDETYLWAGYFMHKGCLNTSSKKAAAIAFHVEIVDNENLNFKSFMFKDRDLLRIYNNIKLLIDEIVELELNLAEKDKFVFNAEKIIKKSDISLEKEIISKIISVISQRIFTYYSDEKNKMLSTKLDLIAYFYDNTNYSSNQRLKNQNLL